MKMKKKHNNKKTKKKYKKQNIESFDLGSSE